jgi:hypothetical protein
MRSCHVAWGLTSSLKTVALMSGSLRHDSYRDAATYTVTRRRLTAANHRPQLLAWLHELSISLLVKAPSAGTVLNVHEPPCN